MTTDEMVLSADMFNRFCDLVYEKAGIKLGPQKEALVSARVSKRIRALKLSGFDEYYHLAKNDETGAELVELLNVISTNVTHFFREEKHFTFLTDVVKEWERKGQTSFKIWCAASSTGEEPYTIAITLKEALMSSSDSKILATDISTKVLGLAKEGLYQMRHMEKMPDKYITKYFQKEKHDGEIKYRANDELRRMISFARLNLAFPPFPMTGPFDVVFCRNVMIYFDNTIRRGLLAEAYRMLKPGGYLMVGHAESLSGMLSEFKTVQPSIYIKG